MKIKSKQHKVINSRTDFFYYAFRNILLVTIPLVFISVLVLSLSHSFATTSGSDNLSLTLSTSCTINSILVEPHTINMGGGQYEDNIGSTRINAYCNDGNGYGIYAIGSSGDTDGNTDLINSADDHYNIHTGIYDSNNITVSTPSSWSMKLTAGTGSGIDTSTGNSIPLTPPTIMNNYDIYNVVPNNYTLVAKRTSGTNMTIDTDVTGSYFTTTYDIYATSVQPAGTYNGKVKYVMVHPNSNNNSINSLEAAFASAGKQPAYQDENGYYYAMQDMTTDICNSVTGTGEITAIQLVDRRDNKLYWVAKLADNKCWMTQNLDLEIGGANTQPLTSDDTDISTNASVYVSSGVYSDYGVNDGVYTWSPVSTAITSNYYLDGTTVKPFAWPTGQTKPYSLEGGEAYVYTSGSASNDTRYTSLSDCATNGRTEAECKRYATGNYYNWTAAIASNDSTNLGSTSEEIASNSICPKNWRLPNSSPTDGVNNEFGRLFYRANITARVSNDVGGVSYLEGTTSLNELRSNPYYFVRSGRINGGALYYDGNYGDYWSSTVYDSTHSYYLNFDNSNLWPATRYSERSSGRSVRCLAR